jgi:hypothetical protein
MPIKIATNADGTSTEVAWLCDDDWRLSSQISALEVWLAHDGATLPKGIYTADIGFAPRSDAAGGGAEITPEMMHRMTKLGMTLFLSEYPKMERDSDESTLKA